MFIKQLFSENWYKNKGWTFLSYLPYLFLLFSSIGFFSNCGLFERKFPPNGTFCNVLAKPVDCIEVEFANRRILFSEKEIYPLEMVSRVEYYYFLNPDKKIQMLVTSEHRVELSDGRFFLRKKVKR